MSSPEMIELSKKAVEEIFRPYNDLILKLAGPLFEQVGEGIGFAGQHFRNRMALKFFGLTKKMIQEAGFDPKAVSPKLFLPILQNASLEEDEDLQSRWAALLTNAANPDTQNGVLPSFPDILGQLTAFEAQFLDRVYDEIAKDEVEAERMHEQFKLGPPSLANLPTECHIRSETLEIASAIVLGNLDRLGLVKESPVSEDVFDKALVPFRLTAFGRAFVWACRAPKSKHS